MHSMCEKRTHKNGHGSPNASALHKNVRRPTHNVTRSHLKSHKSGRVQVRDVSKADLLRVLFDEHPAHVRVPEPIQEAVRVTIRVDIPARRLMSKLESCKQQQQKQQQQQRRQAGALVMSAMVAAPPAYAAFNCSTACASRTRVRLSHSALQSKDAKVLLHLRG